jgi:hypothetical protein
VGACVRVYTCARVCVALLIQHATRIAILSAASLAPPHFFTLSHKRHDFPGGKKVTERKMCVLIFFTTFI